MAEEDKIFYGQSGVSLKRINIAVVFCFAVRDEAGINKFRGSDPPPPPI